MAERIQFGWSIPAEGFRWIAATTLGALEKSPQPALVPAEVEEGTSVGESQAPEDDPALFRRFAEIGANKENILGFANSVGNLTAGVELRPTKSTDAGSGSPLRGTLLDTWKHQIADMQRLVGLWDLLQAEDRERLAPHILWREDAKGAPSVHFASHPGAGKGGGASLGFHPTKSIIASAERRPDWLKKFEPDDPILPGWLYLQTEIDLHLHHTAAEISSLMAWHPQRNRPVLGFAAPTLLAAVWLQVADAVSNNRTFSRCRECAKWLEVAADAARSNRRFCSNACRSKAHRERQDRARRLFAAKKNFEEIARELDSDEATIKRWVYGS